MTSEEKKEIFIKKAKEVHNSENIDYSQVVYINNRTPVKMIDRDLKEDGSEYGEFWQTPYNHLRGQSHPLKKGKRISETKRYDVDKLIERFKKVHKGENLDYSQVNYVNMHTPIKIISHDLRPDGTEYGEFWQEPNAHLRGCTHPELGKRKQILKQTSNTEEFIIKSKIVHYNKNSKGEIIDFIKTFYCGTIETRNHNILNGKEIDIFIPKLNIAFEFNGIRWHSELFNKDKNYHLDKQIECEKRGIKLFHIFEDEFISNKKVVFSKIKHILNYNKDLIKIGGRKCVIQIIDNNQSKIFLNTNHIQGYTKATIHLGAFYKDRLVSVMSFKKNSTKEWEMVRFATDIEYNVQGICSKFITYFNRNYEFDILKTFLDRRWENNKEDNVYIKSGFVIDGILKPDYRYTDGHSKRIHKFNFRKQKLSKKYGFPLSMTESEMANKLGFYKIWDCGLIRYIYKKK